VPAGPLRQGVLALGVAPTEIAAVAVTGMAAGNPAVATAVLALTAVAIVLFAGPVLSLLSTATVAPPVTVLVTLAGVVALPLAVGAAVRRTALGRRLTPLADPLAVLTVTILVWLVASQAELDVSLLPAVGAVLVFLAGSAALGEAVAYRAHPDTAHALRLSLAMRDFAVAAGAATAAFGPAAAAPAALYGVAMLGYGALYARIRTPAAERPRP
jgi:ACR3 family arsenite efflux pump ArsB